MATNFKHKDISKIFDMVRDRDHYTVIRDFFELSAISIRNNFDFGPEHANFEKRYMEIAQGYKKEYLEGFAKAQLAKKAEKWRFFAKNSTKQYKMYDFPHFFTM